MPNLRIETNVSKDKIDMKACLAELSKALANTTGKPEQYMVVQVQLISLWSEDILIFRENYISAHYQSGVHN